MEVLNVVADCRPAEMVEDKGEADRFALHVSLNVSQLDRSVDFYKRLFHTEPAKHHKDYAKFEVADPPVVFSLAPNAVAKGGGLSHLGLRLGDADAVRQWKERLESAGICVSCQNGVVCGYALQDKIWVADPDHNYWEFYCIHGDVDPEDHRSGFDGESPTSAPPGSALETEYVSSADLVWEHRITHPAPGVIDRSDCSVEEVRLEGSLNLAGTAESRQSFLGEVFRVLKPGGRLRIHGLGADKRIPEDEEVHLPGMAALVRRVPTYAEAGDELSTAGFTDVQFAKLARKPDFQFHGIGLREMKLEAQKPGEVSSSEPLRLVLYKGPFAQARDDQGNVFDRGIRTSISQSAFEILAASEAATQFLFLEDASSADCLCTG